MAARAFAAIARVALRRPLAVVAGVAVLSAAAAVAAFGLRPTGAVDTLVSRSDSTYRATQSYHRLFGDDAVIVLVRTPPGQLSQLVLTQDLERVLGLEGCLSGNDAPHGVVPAQQGGPHSPCGALAREHPAQVVYGPGTFINEAVSQLADQFTQESAAKAAQAQRVYTAAYHVARARGAAPAQARQLAKQAQQLVYAEFTRSVLQLALRYGIRSVPRLNDPDFVSALVFDPLKRPGTPKARFAYLFPNPDPKKPGSSALVQVRLRAGLSDAARAHAITLIRQAVRMPQWHLQNGETYTVTGAPVVLSDLTSSISHSILILLLAAVVVMAGTLALVFRSRLRLLPLGIALCAAALTFGALALVGASLTMASIAVLPILIGLAVDYAIQFQSRFNEATAGGAPAPDAVLRTVGRGVPTIAAAGAATAGGFLALLLSPVPMVRGFGVLLVVGIVLAFACTLTAGAAVLVLAGRGGAPRLDALGLAGPRLSQSLGGALRRGGEGLLAAWRGAGELIVDNRVWRRLAPEAIALRERIRRAGRDSFTYATQRPRHVLALAAGLAVLGWLVDTQTHVESNVQKLVPQNLPALQDLQTLETTTGVGGEIDVTVAASDLTSPRVVGWMTAYQAGLLQHFGYSSNRPCGKAQLCPAFSLPDLLGGLGSAPRQTDIRALLNSIPPYFSQGVITPDHRTATLAFGIRLMPLDQQKSVIDAMRARLHPPSGVKASLVGLPVLAAEANARLSSPWRRDLTLLAGLLAVGVILLLALRRGTRGLIALLPIVLATGWSALVLFCLRVPLNPMSVTLGALVVAITTEFSVLLSERYRHERDDGHPPTVALERTYASTGAAVLASGVTAIAGFAVLVFSDIRMLRDFGLVTVVDLTAALLGVMVVLPAVLVLAERGELARLPGELLGWLARARPRLRRPSAA
ncbi:MAG TPA: MMPL family transporter [Solirubrobacteraceae bacterium]|nr:MMPL family transporter [Solirubrobacteraceae bacterium]